MSDKPKEIVITNITKQKVQVAKSYIEQRYSKLLQQEQQKKQYWEQLNQKMQMLGVSIAEQQQIKKKIMHQEAQISRKQRIKLTIKDFASVKIIGKGAFGQVRLCKWLKNGQPVAVKKLKKSEMIFKNKIVQSREQRNVLANSQKNPWVVGLKCSFQDTQNLYLVMEYLPGGDLMNLLIKKDIFTHEQAQFYTSQILLALDSVHNMKYIHRDLKPDNVLLDAYGHIKLSDFGLCKHTQIRPKRLTDGLVKKQQIETLTTLQKKMEKPSHISNNRDVHKRNRKLAYSAVGTPDYVAPQVQGKIGYTQTVDWWSMGVILYEMLVGYPPFASEDPSQTWHKIQNWKKYLVIPRQAKVSPQATDLIKKLIADPRDRLGTNGVQQIKAHPFFAGINWSKLRQKKSPYIPGLKGIWDTDNFDPYQEEDPWIPAQELKGAKKYKKKTTQFIGYTYKPIQQPNSGLLKALLDLDNYKLNQFQSSNRKNLQYLQLEETPSQMTNSNCFLKKQKSGRLNQDIYTTSSFFNSIRDEKSPRQKLKYNLKKQDPNALKLKQQKQMIPTLKTTLKTALKKFI